ncbi:non-ribosomal peptide synthetase [Catellatospora methionotrophica]|uniref:non-ribosomal peptide synthetase n=1 Tax=Catellatospora methionotrophica TaxID=121620 RepID=UPI0033C8C5CF
MLSFPVGLTRSEQRSWEARSWELEEWQALALRNPELSASQLLSAAVGVLFHRYGLPCDLTAAGGCGSPQAVRAMLDRSPRDTTWCEVLAAAASDSGDTERPDPGAIAVYVGDGDRLIVDADVIWTASERGVNVNWDTSVLPESTIEAMVGHLVGLSESLAMTEGVALADVCILSEEELAMNGGTPECLPKYPPITLHQMFSLQAWRTPEACALRSEAGVTPYRDLDNYSNRLACDLVEAGVRVGDVVAVAGERSVGLIAAVIGVMKAGGALLYLDPSMPEPRRKQFVDVGQPTAIMLPEGSLPPGPAEPTTMRYSAEPDSDEFGPCGPPNVVVSPESPSHIIFTSGSTGVPKGVLRPHRMTSSRIFLEQGMYPLGPDDRVLVKAVISTREVFWPLAVGAALVLVKPGGERDDQYLLNLIRSERVSVLPAAPGVWLQAFVASPDFGKCTSIRHIFVGGEPLHRPLEDKVRAHGFALHNTYTQTEADYITHRSGPPGVAAGEHSVIGRPLDMRVYLCDDHGRLVPPGLVGEIWTGGVGLSTGYYRDGERSAEKFVPNPFGDPEAPLLCKTGDLARHLADGMLEYRGRKDLQIKVRGNRLEPAEVESWIKQHPSVQDAVVVGFPDEEHGALLVGYVVLGNSATSDVELRRFLAERLPDYMVPSYLVRLAHLPLLASGKVDRAELKPRERVRPAGLPAAAAPQTPAQSGLLHIWRRVLQVDDIGVDDDYVALGGDSLRFLLLRAAIQEEFAIPVDIADLMGAATIRAQERLVTASAPAGVKTTHHTRIDAGAIKQERARRAAARELAP